MCVPVTKRVWMVYGGIQEHRSVVCLRMWVNLCDISLPIPVFHLSCQRWQFQNSTWLPSGISHCFDRLSSCERGMLHHWCHPSSLPSFLLSSVYSICCCAEDSIHRNARWLSGLSSLMQHFLIIQRTMTFVGLRDKPPLCVAFAVTISYLEPGHCQWR